MHKARPASVPQNLIHKIRTTILCISYLLYDSYTNSIKHSTAEPRLRRHDGSLSFSAFLNALYIILEFEKEFSNSFHKRQWEIRQN